MRPHKFGILLERCSRRLADLNGICVGLADSDFPLAQAAIEFHVLALFSVCQKYDFLNDQPLVGQS
jgi:hypothetical protein